MNITPECKAQQHLLVQGFTLYTCPAVVCIRLVSPTVLDTHQWAVIVDSQSMFWVDQLSDEDSIKQLLAAACREGGKSNTLCHFRGTYLIVPLEVTSVRNVKDRLEKANEMNVVPPSTEGLLAIPDSILEAEIKRRKREQAAEAEPSSDLNQRPLKRN